MRTQVVLAASLLLCVAASTEHSQAQSQPPSKSDKAQPTISVNAPISAKQSLPFGDAELANWSADVDVGAFNRLLDERGVQLRATSRPIVGNQLDLVLPDRGTVSLEVTGMTELVKGVTTIEGVMKSDSESTFTLSIENGQMLGVIRDGFHSWMIEPDGERHRLRRVDRRLIPRATDSYESRDSKSLPDPEPSMAKTGGTGRVDILFLYASDVSSPGSIASNIVSDMNSALDDSGVSSNNYVASAGVEPIYDDFDDVSISSIVFDMENLTAPFQYLTSEYMFHAQADIAILIVQEDPGAPGFPGYGRVGGGTSDNGQLDPYSVTTDDYAIGDYTALHEAGHLFGGEHENFSGGFNRGKVKNDDTWQTVMGGYEECTFDGLPASCDRIRYFSNPAVSFGGESTGLVGPLGRDMHTHLESTMVNVSGWFDASGGPDAPDNPPTSFSASNAYCNGLYDIDWSDVSGATTYRLYQSNSSSFPSHTVVYTGVYSDVQITVPSGISYYRVRACNSGGCSDNSATVSATYFSGCP